MSLPPAPSRQRRLIVLGSTGSIGVNTLEVAEHLASTEAMDLKVVGLAAGTRGDDLISQAKRFTPEAVAIADASQHDKLVDALPGVAIFSGDDAAEKLVREIAATDVMAAMVGSAGLPATVAAIQNGSRIGLANKETLVAAGAIVTPLVKRHHAELIPVDSEHSAIFQCLQSRSDRVHDSVARIVLTASGGPFRTATQAEIKNATIKEALNHPTWEMGQKITIDSASMMNKALEVIEAHWLFDQPAEKLDIVVHPQSIIHSFVEFSDGSILAQLGAPDMKTPIQYALTYPDRAPGCSDALDWSKLTGWTFEPPDPDRFPSIRLAYDVIRDGGTSGTIFNAANEAAVAAFLEQKIRFGRIFEIVGEALQQLPITPATDLETIFEIDKNTRDWVSRQIAR